MATILAANTGNWSATGTWTGGVVPVAGDVVVANGKTVTMDTLTVTVAELRNDTTGGAVAGGTFNLVNGSNVTANVYAGSSATSCVTWTGTVGQTATVTGSFFGPTLASGTAAAINVTGAGNLVCGAGSQATGGVAGGLALGIYFQSSGSLTFGTALSPGAITGGSGGSGVSSGISCNANNSTITIYATSITASTNSGGAAGLYFSGSNQNVNIVASNIGTTTATNYGISAGGLSANHTYTVSGNIIGSVGLNASAVFIANTGAYSITVAGAVSGGTGSNAGGISNGSLATVNIVGNITNNVSAQNNANYSIGNSSLGIINITGTITAGNIQHTASNSSTGILRCTRAKGNGFGVGSVGINNVQAVLSIGQSALTYIEELEFGSLGQTPVTGPIRFTSATSNKVIFTTTTGSIKTLIDTTSTSGIVPNSSDVRSGVTYNSGNNTGTCAVPSSSSVALNVPVDNTVGTAFLNVSDIRPAIGLASANLDTQLQSIPNASQNATAVRSELANELARINNCATVATTGQQIENAFQ